ncbi:serpin-ZX-like [Lotus japonicus]|uniref:serpin-ZX-like n=1 Tax=Lotus japonicus TaxID=34305 RepID=UPI002585BFFA|nr:serpin-ZX-like [Lotus japonicus]
MELEKSKSNSINVALSFTKHVLSKEEYREKNVAFSPLSLYAALSVMAASADGPTHDDHLTTFFSQVLSPVFSSGDAAADSQHHLCFANGMWADKSLSLSHSFKQIATTHYKAALNSVDFQTEGDQVLREVNSLIEKENNGLIRQPLPPGSVSSSTKVMFANALLFKGEWKHKFDGVPSRIVFHLLNGTSVMVPTMTCKKRTQYISAFDGFQILRLPYKQGRDRKRRFSMCIFVPDAKDGLPVLIHKLSSESAFLKGKLPRRKVRVASFRIPSFNIPFTFEASNVLKEVGVVSPFSHSDADFTKMTKPSDKLYLENLFHKAFIDVNQKGTEATTSATAYCRIRLHHANFSKGIDFMADCPFLFLIREDFTGTILFVGQVLNPLDGADPVKEVSGRRSLRSYLVAKYKEQCVGRVQAKYGVGKVYEDVCGKCDVDFASQSNPECQ